MCSQCLIRLLIIIGRALEVAFIESLSGFADVRLLRNWISRITILARAKHANRHVIARKKIKLKFVALCMIQGKTIAIFRKIRYKIQDKSICNFIYNLCLSFQPDIYLIYICIQLYVIYICIFNTYWYILNSRSKIQDKSIIFFNAFSDICTFNLYTYLISNL